MNYAKKIDIDFIQSYKSKVPPWGPLGYITYKRTYARMTEDGITEEWHQTVGRCCQGILDIGGIFTQSEIRKFYDYVFNLKCCFSGRALWQLGTKTVEKIGADSLQNCWHVAINTPEAFMFTFNQLMLGGGVGFTLTQEHVYELPTVKYGVKINRLDENDVDLIVTDNREGWVDLLRRVFQSFFYTGKNLIYATHCIRQRGKPITSFGGVASGSENLVEGISKIASILSSRVGNKLRPIDCLDIMNIIGTVVVAGNVRRAAELALGSPDDLLFIQAKSWGSRHIPNWRNMSNNSVICDDIRDLPDSFWDNYEAGKGEPYGLINLNLCRTFGRLADGPDYRLDPNVTGVNPCAEITMESFEACNLAEIFLPNIFSVEEFITAANLVYKVTKCISKYPFSDPIINEVVNRNHRLGNGVTGVLQSRWLHNPDVFTTVYRSIEELDISYSKNLGIETSIKLTTVKPSGTLSLLPGVTPGIHPAFSKYYIRRIRFSSDDPLVDLCQSKGYHAEPQRNFDGSANLDTMVVDFPVETPNKTILAKNTTAIDQLDFQFLMQNCWSDNAVSLTCYYKAEELERIKNYLKEDYAQNIKTVSFLLHSEHGFKQAPYEEITKEEYERRKRPPIVSHRDTMQRDFEESLECVGGMCPVK